MTQETNPCNVIRNCHFCQHFRNEEIGDSGFGGVYASYPTCSKDFDIDPETEKYLPDFDREIERECCELDFWVVVEVDKVLSEKLAAEYDNGDGSYGFNETYDLFKSLYIGAIEARLKQKGLNP